MAKAKPKRKQFKSKRQRQRWWADLTPEQQEKWLSAKLWEKGRLRKEKQEATATIGGISNCDTCFHLVTKNCEGLSNTENCCRYWYNPNENVIGMAYLEQVSCFGSVLI